jgi:heme-degrading monooxygenase HmoA
MIARIWHGWANEQNADAYEQLLQHEIFVSFRDKKINGYKGVELLKRTTNTETEFTTIMYFENLDAVKEFAGKDYEKAVVPEKAQKLLQRYDATSQHYEIIKERES